MARQCSRDDIKKQSRSIGFLYILLDDYTDSISDLDAVSLHGSTSIYYCQINPLHKVMGGLF